MKKGVTIVLVILAVIVVIALVYFVSKKTDGQIQNTGDTEKVNSLKYELISEEKNMTPGVEFSKSSFGEEQNYSEIPSCAFEGVDKVYNYGSYEITTSNIDGKEVIYSTYLLDDGVSTPEGVKIADDKSVMLNAYGENYTLNGAEYLYTDGNVNLSFIVENDVITSISYVMVTNN